MKQAGLSDDLVIAKIRQSNKGTDLSTDELVTLKKQGISDAVIKILMHPAEPTTPDAGADIAKRLLNVTPQVRPRNLEVLHR